MLIMVYFITFMYFRATFSIINTLVNCTLNWCARRESNPHDLFSQGILSPSRLPIPPLALKKHYTTAYDILEYMKQLIFIHGGDSYDTYDEFLRDLVESPLDYERLRPSANWKEWIIGLITDADILVPRLPNSQNAQYDEWKIYFEKLIPFFGDNVTLIGHSLGAMFLAKYLHEKPLNTPVKRLILLAGGYDEETERYGSFRIKSAAGLEKSAEEIHLMHSKDDPVVPYEALEKYVKDLPTAIVHRFEDKNHFLDTTFPELLRIL